MPYECRTCLHGSTGRSCCFSWLNVGKALGKLVLGQCLCIWPVKRNTILINTFYLWMTFKTLKDTLQIKRYIRNVWRISIFKKMFFKTWFNNWKTRTITYVSRQNIPKTRSSTTKCSTSHNSQMYKMDGWMDYYCSYFSLAALFAIEMQNKSTWDVFFFFFFFFFCYFLISQGESSPLALMASLLFKLTVHYF